MTMPRYPHRKRIAALLLVILTLRLVSVTAGSGNALAAVSALSEHTELAVTLLRAQLGGVVRDELPAAAAFAIAQSPLLFARRDAILELRRSEERDEGGSVSAPDTPAPDNAEQTAPVPETPEIADPPLVIADNGVSARTLVPSSAEGYVVTGDVYIDNRSDKRFDASLFIERPAVELTIGDAPQVLIVHTHGSEAYTMPPGEEYVPSGDCRTTDENYSVVRVGAEIASVLRASGIRVIHDTTLHDYPRYSGAYERSLSTVEQYIERYPSIVLVLDVHRDAVSDSAGNMYKVVSGVAGLNAAQMSFVIGTDGGGLSHPHWQENLKLAVAIQQTLCADHSTLMRPITVRNSRYNQHTTTGSLLVEMGAAGNSLDEALLSARLLGAAIIKTLCPPSEQPDAPQKVTQENGG